MHQSIKQSIHQSINPSINPSIHQSINPSIHVPDLIQKVAQAWIVEDANAKKRHSFAIKRHSFANEPLVLPRGAPSASSATQACATF
eukprot:1188133-Prorocentrum_minimum.AAC.2